MSNPLADPRAADLLAAQPDEVSAVAAALRTAASNADTTAAGLRAAGHDATWTGPAANGFREAIGRMPRPLGRIGDALDGVSRALDGYEATLAPLRSRFIDTVTALAATGPDDPGRPVLEQRAFALLDEFGAARGACTAAILAQGAPPSRGATTGPGSGTTVVG